MVSGDAVTRKTPMEAAAVVGDERPVEEAVSYAVLLAERVRAAAENAESFKSDCFELGNNVDRLSPTLRSLARFSSFSSSALYDRPARRIISDVCAALQRALALARRFRRRNFLRRVFTITATADFRKVQNLLDNSVGDMKWLLSIFRADGDGGIEFSLPPIASNDPILSWVWSSIASIHYGEPSNRAEAANQLASLAGDNDRNKQMIVDEGGIPPLLKLLKDASDPEGQIAAATALINLSNDQERVRVIVKELGVPIMLQALGESPMRVQILVANLVARMAKNDELAQEDFARENAIRPLVTSLAFDIGDDRRTQLNSKPSIHSVLEMNRKKGESLKTGSHQKNLHHLNSHSYPIWDGSTKAGSHRKEWETETSEVKIKLKTSCARALWMLSAGSIANSQRITETKGLLCLAKLIEKEQGELQYNCLMAVMEITSAAESNADLRQAAFKTNSPAAKAVVEQLQRVIKEADDKLLQIPAIRSIGSLARTFPARETHVIVPLVRRLNHMDPDVSTEAAVALSNFACPKNFLRTEHSKTIIELDAVPALIELLWGNEKQQFHGLRLLCYLAMHSVHNEKLDQARVLKALEGADRSVAAYHFELKELIVEATYHLRMYHSAGVGHSQKLSYNP